MKCDCFQTPCIIRMFERHEANIGAEWSMRAETRISRRSPMELISLNFTALYFCGGRPLFFTTRPSRGINHKLISREPSFRFAVFSSCLFLSFRPPTLFITSLPSFVKYKTYACRENARGGQINKYICI